MGVLASPRRESPGERASAAGPAGRSKAGSFRRSHQQNTVSVRKNGRYPPPLSPPLSIPPSSRLPAPPPPNDPPPRAPPPRTPREEEERDPVVKQYSQTSYSSSSTSSSSSSSSASSPRKNSKTIRAESPGRPATPPKRPPRPASELFVERPPDLSVRPLRAVPIRAATTTCASRGTSPLRQMTNIQHLQSRPSEPPRPLSGLSREIIMIPSAVENPPKCSSSRASVRSLRRPPLSEESINATAAQMIRERRRRDSSSSSTMTSSPVMSSSISLPYPLIRPTPHAAPPPPPLTPYRTVSLSSLRRARNNFLGGGSSSSNHHHHGRRHTRQRSSVDLGPKDNRSIFTKRIDAAAAARPLLFDIDDLKKKHPMGVAKSTRPTSPPTATKPQRRKRRKGETMSMLLDDGFFPVEEFVYNRSPPTTKAKKNRYTSMAGFKINLPPRLSFIEMNSPLSPTSPTSPDLPPAPRGGNETPTTPRSARSRRHVGVGQSLLPQISESEDVVASDQKAATGVEPGHQTSPSKFTADSEAGIKNSIKNSIQNSIKDTTKDGRGRPPSPGTVAPVATQIQLRNGSIVTLTPPELTAWQPSLYLHGPIKLPKPTIMPRKNSVATLDPFQDAIEKLYQNTLAIPRRRSDDAVVDDICEFFDAFGFDLISFAGDDFSKNVVDCWGKGVGIGEVRDITTLETTTTTTMETFNTPPMEPTIVTAPAEAMIASNAMLEQQSQSQSQRSPSPSPVLQAPPPVENEETLRARGIARLSRNSANFAGASSSSSSSSPSSSEEGRPGARKESITLGKPQTSAVLPLLPAPETSMLDAVLQPVQQQRNRSYTASVYSQRHPVDGAGKFHNHHHSLVHRRDHHAGLRTTRTSSSGGVRGVDDGGVEEMMSVEMGWKGVGRPVAGITTAAAVPSTSKEPKLSRMRRLVASASSIL